MRVLITGASGLLGGRLAELLAARFEVTAARHSAPPPPGLAEVFLDLLAPATLEAALERARPDGVVHCAALADADACEADPERAYRANAEASGQLARLASSRGIRLVAISTDLVFDGRSRLVPEHEPARPILAYGRTKLAGEEAVLEQAPESVVLRVALVLGRGCGRRSTASEGIAWALRAGRPLRLFTDQYRTPVDPESVAGAAASALLGRGRGRYHVGGPERLSRHELGLRVAAAFGLDASRIEAATQAESPIGVPRPADVSLDSGRARRELGFRPLPLADAIRQSRLAPG